MILATIITAIVGPIIVGILNGTIHIPPPPTPTPTPSTPTPTSTPRPPVPQYNFVRKWNSAGPANGQLHFPQGIAVDSANNVYVADSGNNRIQVFAPSTNITSR